MGDQLGKGVALAGALFHRVTQSVGFGQVYLLSLNGNCPCLPFLSRRFDTLPVSGLAADTLAVAPVVPPVVVAPAVPEPRGSS